MANRTEVFTPLTIASEQSEDGLIRGVLLCGNRSKNGYDIPPAAFGSDENVKSLYNDVPVFFNHSEGVKKNPMSRDAKGAVGTIRNARLVDGRPYGDIEPFDTSDGQHLRSLVKAQPKYYGLSHVAKYNLNYKTKTVVAVENVFSVDVVINPATTQSFTENENRMEELEFFKEQISELKDSKKQADEKITLLSQECESLKEKIKTLDEANVVLKSEKTKIESELSVFQAEQTKAEKIAQIKKQCEDAKIPAEGVTDLFVESLINAGSDEAVEGLIKERVELFSRVSGGSTKTVAQQRRTPEKQEWNVSDSLSGVVFN